MKRALLAALVALSACTKKEPPPPSPPSAVDGGGPALSSSASKPKRPVTTSWEIAGGNLDGEIAERMRLDKGDPGQRRTIVSLLLTRVQFVANTADYAKAEDLAKETLEKNPKNVEAHRAQASVHAALHRFAAAQKELDEAQRLGASANDVAESRATIAMALGHYDQASGFMHDDVLTAALAARTGKVDESERLFTKARDTMRDVSPFTLAWIDFQHATALDLRGEPTKAMDWYAEAVDVIPVYAHAVVHLALAEPPDKAIARLVALENAKTTDDPDVPAALADAHRRAKHDAEAKAAAGAARARFEALLEKWPEAYADHAARFFLKDGADPKRALDLAKKNAALRSTEEAIDLWSGAAAATNDKAEMCASAKAMSALTYASAEHKRLAAAALSGCP